MEPLKIDWVASDYLNAGDLNRVEKWSEELHNKLLKHGYKTIYNPGKVWTNQEIPTVEDMDRIRSNVTAIKDGYFSIPEWRDILLGHFHDFNQQNAMEWDLQTCYNYIEKMIQIFPPSGVYKSGNVYYLTDEMYFWPVIPYPTITSNLTYNGSPQTPSFSNPDAIEIEGEKVGTDAGFYTAKVRPKHGSKWDTGVRIYKDYRWEIKKAQGELSLGSSSVTMDKKNYSIRIPVYYQGEGKISVSADNGNAIVVYFDNNFIQVVSSKKGNTRITVSGNGDKNHTKPNDVYCDLIIADIVDTSAVSGSAESGSVYYIGNGI